MTGYTLTWRDALRPPLPSEGEGWGDGESSVPIDVTLLRPDTLGSLASDTLARTALRLGRTTVPLADLFTIAGASGDTLTLRNLPPLPGVGAGMTGGTLVIDGDAGDDLGASMKGGTIRVRGHAGHRIGGPAPARDRGMTGGQIVVEGDAGDHVGYRMRRGLIAVCGRSGASPGFNMLAGTVVLLGGPVDHPGLEMRRGTVYVADADAQVKPGAAFGHATDILASAAPVFALLHRELRRLNLPLRDLATTDRLRFWSGDRFELGKGEIVQWLN